MKILRAAFLLIVSTFAFAQNSAPRLNQSPRHQEWIVVKNGERQVHAFVVYPQSKEKSTAVLLIHENKGLTDWVRGLADQVAEAGFIAVAPDLLSGMAE